MASITTQKEGSRLRKEIDEFSQLSRFHFNKWEKGWKAKFPELVPVNDYESFLRVQKRNPDIPFDAWLDYSKSQEYGDRVKNLKKQLLSRKGEERPVLENSTLFKGHDDEYFFDEEKGETQKREIKTLNLRPSRAHRGYSKDKIPKIVTERMKQNTQEEQGDSPALSFSSLKREGEDSVQTQQASLLKDSDDLNAVDTSHVVKNGGVREELGPDAIRGMETLAVSPEIAHTGQNTSAEEGGSAHQSEGADRSKEAEYAEMLASLNDEGRRKIEDLARRYEEGLGREDRAETLRGGPQLTAPILPSPVSRISVPPRQDTSHQAPDRDRMSISDKIRFARRVAGGGGGGEFGFLSRMLRPNPKNIIQGVVRVLSVIPGGKITMAVIIAIIVLLVLAFIIIMKSSDGFDFGEEQPEPTTPAQPGGPGGGASSPIPGLTLFLPEVAPVPAGGEATIPINVSYSGSQNIEVIASIPPGARFVTATGSYEVLGDLIVWQLSANSPSTEESDGGDGLSSSLIALYNSYGFPNPTDPVTFSSDEVYRWNNFLKPHAERAASIVGVDVGFIGMWPYHENRFMSHMDNCGDADGDPNTPCNWNIVMWQVGWGVFPSWERQLIPEAMAAMHPGRTIQEVGQAVIDSSDDPSRYPPEGSWFYEIYYNPYDSSFTFPDITLDALMARAEDPTDEAAQKLIVVLMKDDAIGAYILAKKWKGYVDSNGRLGPNGNWTVADLMESWPPYDPYNRQRIINEIAGLYNTGITLREYELSFTIEPAEGENLTVPDYTVSGRVVGEGTENIN